MKYEFVVLAALVQLKHANTRVIVNSTGISERKVRSVVKDLHLNLGICFKKEKKLFLLLYRIFVFETGSSIFERLYKLDLAKASRISSKNQRKRKLLSLSDKIEYSNSVKLKNYNESLRLEGISSKKTDLSANKKQLQDERYELLKYYAKRAQLVNA
ncbi:YhfG family protein [Gayadomonas joobiniege]|uniref:YhfG family protein n=1 Tax=Gayadomonas joobiniege TaxID=1234606 RepID=UPI0003663049|nr:hypothetical protein [Gayadomonas joobiniege]